MKKRNIFLLVGILGTIVLYFASQFINYRIDTTSDQRYTLTETSKNIIESIDKKLSIKILLDGELTGDYRTLKNETKFLLEEIQNLNSNVEFEFVNPTEEFSQAELDTLLSPVPIKVDKGTLNIYPYAKLTYDGEKGKQETWTRILTDDPSISFENLALASTEKLEYLLVRDIQRITNTNRKNIGVIVHHDELPERHLISFLQNTSEKYNIEIYFEPLKDSTLTLKAKDLEKLKKYDALIVPKPTLPFTDDDKLVLDQYIMNGGKTLWMLENVDAEMDSIFRSDQILAFPRKLNLNDFFFAYGIRLMPVLVKDLQGGKIVLADGETAGNTSYNFYTWPYFIQAGPAEKHPINESLTAVRMEFANPIELLDNPNVNQTVLLSSSPQTTFKSALSRIYLGDVNVQNPDEYQAGLIPTAVLLEGNFQSAYANRFESKEFPNFKSNTVDGKMIVISDGDVIKNHLWNGQPMELGADKYTLRFDNQNQKPIVYENQSFLMNCLDYLLGEKDFLFLKNRSLAIPLLDENKVRETKSKWQMLNLLIPTILIGLIGFSLIFLRKKRFAK